MADEQSRPPFNKPSPIPKGKDWRALLGADGDDLEILYRHTLEELGKRAGMLGVIFRKAQNKIQDPAKLRRLILDLIDKEQWSSLSADVKGDAYEGLLQKNAEDVKGGAGQYFTPRPLIAAMVDVVQPAPGNMICDPACGTGGFLLAAHDYIARHYQLDRAQKKKLRNGTLFGIELVDGVTRLCAMNLLLHGIGSESDLPLGDGGLPVVTKDALAGKHGEYEIVLANPPFGKKSSVTIVNEAGESSKESLIINRDDFWASTSNKQLNFLQHIFTILKQHGRAAVVLTAALSQPAAEPSNLTLSPAGSRPGRVSHCEPFASFMQAGLDRGLSAQRIHQDLVSEQQFTGGYDSVKRFVRQLEQPHPLPFRRMESEPGQEAQVDFGQGAWVVEEGRRRRPHVLRVVLSHSRKGYTEVFWRQTTENFVRGLENALRHFGGVVRTLVIDNLRAAVKKVDWFEPELNPKVVSFCEHYGTVILPTKPAMPRHNAKVSYCAS